MRKLTYKNSLFTTNEVLLTAGNGYGAVNTMIRRYTNSTVSGSAMTYTDSANNGASITINETGLYAISGWEYRVAAGTAAFGASRNSAQLTTNVASITSSTLLGLTYTNVGFCHSFSRIVKLNATDVIRPHGDGNGDSTDANLTRFVITKVG